MKTTNLNRDKRQLEVFGDSATGDAIICPDCNSIVPTDKTHCLNCGWKVEAPDGTITQVVQAAGLAASIDAAILPTFTDDIAEDVANTYTILSGDSKRGIMRVRQLATRADAINLNNRIYPREVLNAGISEAQQFVLAGAMDSEREHPEIVKKKDGTTAYVNNIDRKTAFIDALACVDAKGDVYVERTIAKTAEGRKVAKGFNEGNPPGLSMRFQGDLADKLLSDGRTVGIAKRIIILGFDDVDRPALSDTRRNFELLTDSVKAELGLPSVKEKENKQMDKFKRALNALNLLVAQKADPAKITKARQLCYDTINDINTAGEDTSDATAALAKADSTIAIAGYCAGQGPTGVTFGRVTATPVYAPDMEANAQAVDPDKPGEQPEPVVNEVLAKGDAAATKKTILGALGMDEDEVTEFKAQSSAAKKAKAEKVRVAAIDSVIDADEAFKKLTEDEQKFVRLNTQKMAAGKDDAAAVLEAQIDSVSAFTAAAKLAAKGANRSSGATGQTTNDPANPANKEAIAVSERPSAMMAEVDRILAAIDETASINPQHVSKLPTERAKLRVHNRKLLEPMIQDFLSARARAGNGANLAAAIDSCMGDGDPANISKAFGDSISNLEAHYDSTTLANMYNQPTIAMALLIQQFQDLEMFQFIAGIGPTAPSANRAGWENQAFNNGQFAVLRVPSEYYNYNSPQGYGQFAGPQYDAGFLVPEGIGIPEIQVLTSWQPFAPSWRRIAAAATRDVIKAMGHGPLNYDVIGRHLYHMTFAKNRAVDKAIGDNMLQTSDEYLAKAVAAESVNLTNNSAYAAGGSVTVNLNPAKTANATVVSTTDAFVTYGTGVIGAVRLLSGGNGTSSPYFGNSVWGATPLVQPRVITDFTAAGVITTATINPFALSAPGSAVQGYIDANGNIQTLPGGGAAATFAVDYQNGVVLFSSGVSGSSGAITTAVTVSTYSYATNFLAFNAITNVGANYTAPETKAQYFNQLLQQHDTVAANMGSSPRFVKPNLALMSLNASTYITLADIFYKFNSPDGTDLFPTENYFYQRNGIRGARHNTPWYGGDRRILFTQEGTTKYAIDTPLEARGPYPKYDANGNIIATDLYYMEENSVICTPQVQNQAGTVINPVSESLLLY